METSFPISFDWAIFGEMIPLLVIKSKEDSWDDGAAKQRRTQTTHDLAYNVTHTNVEEKN